MPKPNPTAVRLFDAVFGFLLRPRLRRVRRWSFLVTAPLGFLIGRSLGLDLGDGVALGAVAALLDAVVVAGVALTGARDSSSKSVATPCSTSSTSLCIPSPGGASSARRACSRRFPPRCCAACVQSAARSPPATGGRRSLASRLHCCPRCSLRARRSTCCFRTAGCGRRPPSPRFTSTARSCSCPGGSASARTRTGCGAPSSSCGAGRLYRARVETTDVAGVELVPRRDGQRSCLVLGDGPARLAVSGRTDVLLRFGAPVRVGRPLGGPIPVNRARDRRR